MDSLQRMFEKSSYKDYDKFVDNRSKHKKLYRQRIKDLIKELTLPCLFCGSEDDIVFHHVNANDKVSTVTALKSIKAVKKEVEKCWCLCTSCHTKLHQRLIDPLPTCYD